MSCALRANTTEQMGVDSGDMMRRLMHHEGGQILLVDDSRASADRVRKQLLGQFDLILENEAISALKRCSDHEFDCVMINLDMRTFDPLRLCAQLRSIESSRLVPILVLAQESDQKRIMRAFELGVNDYICQPVDKNELLARLRTQVLRKRYTDALRDSIQHTMGNGDHGRAHQAFTIAAT